MADFYFNSIDAYLIIIYNNQTAPLDLHSLH